MVTIPFLALSLAFQTGIHPGIPDDFRTKPVTQDQVLATVNGVPILAKNIESYLWQWRGAEVTEEFISLTLVRQAALNDHVTVTKAEIEAKVRDGLEADATLKQKDPNDKNPNLNAQQVLESEGFPLSRLYVRAEIEVLVNKMALAEFHPGDYVKCSTIIFRAKDATADSVAYAAKAASSASDALKKGTSWMTVLESTSPSDPLKKSEGSIGWHPLTAFPLPLQKQIPTLKIGGYTDPVQTPAGFQIFRIDNIGSQAKPLEIKDLEDQFLKQKSSQIIQKIQSDAKVTRNFPLKPLVIQPTSNEKTGSKS